MSKAKRELLKMIREQRARLDPRLLSEMRDLLDKAGMIPEVAQEAPEKPVKPQETADTVPYDSENAHEAVRLFLAGHDERERMEQLIRARLKSH